jgi:predicted amidohydrolase YtcJ
MRELNRLGVTGDPGGGFQNYPQEYAIIQKLADDGQLTVRLAYNCSPKSQRARRRISRTGRRHQNTSRGMSISVRDMPLDGLNWFFDHAETISDRSMDRISLAFRAGFLVCWIFVIAQATRGMTAGAPSLWGTARKLTFSPAKP